jgi:hypothetical protein
MDLESTDLSIVSVETLDSLLLSESISVVSEDALLPFLLNVDSSKLDFRVKMTFPFWINILRFFLNQSGIVQ